MESKTFRAPNVMTALEEVQRELGPDAIVISVRQVPPNSVWQVWRNPEVEVIAAAAARNGKKPAAPAEPPPTTPEAIKAALVSATAASSAEPAAQPAKASAPAVRPGTSAANGQKTAVKPASPAAFPALPKAKPAAAEPAAEPASPEPVTLPGNLPKPLASFQKNLLSQGIDTVLLNKVISACLETLRPQALEDEHRVRHFLSQQMQAEVRIRQADMLFKDRVVCLVGMSGAGRTNLCAKIAVTMRQGHARKIAWVCADTISTGAISESRLYTEALAIPLHVVYTPGELANAVMSEGEAGLVLVDTPACNPYKESSLVELCDILTALPNRATYLVAPATAKEADLQRLLMTLKAFNLRGLMLTHLDETNSYGNVYNLAWRSQLPLVYFSSGARVPADLQPADAKQLVEALFGEGWAR